MSEVERWAQGKAARLYGQGFEIDTIPVHHVAYAHCWVHGATHAFDVLLSDEAVEAAARRLFDGKVWNFELDEARAALQAAVRAVTKGENDE